MRVISKLRYLTPAALRAGAGSINGLCPMRINNMHRLGRQVWTPDCGFDSFNVLNLHRFNVEMMRYDFEVSSWLFFDCA